MTTVLTMENIEITFVVILAACSAFASLFGVYKIFKEMRQPQRERDRRLDEIECKLANDKKDLEEITECLTIMLECHLLTMDHILDGNDVKAIGEMRKRLEKFLVERKMT